MKTATWIKDLNGFTGAASLYKLSHKFEKNRFVVVSATISPFSGSETYIFGADENGKVINWAELNGSFRGSLDHKKALENAGYKINDILLENKQKQLK